VRGLNYCHLYINYALLYITPIENIMNEITAQNINQINVLYSAQNYAWELEALESLKEVTSIKSLEDLVLQI
jgi:hypothetical protein